MHFSFFQGIEEGCIAIKADEFDFASEGFPLERLQHTVSRSLVRAIDALHAEGFINRKAL